MKKQFAMWGLLATCIFAAPAVAQSTAPTDTPPLSWVDADTGHRIVRLTSEPNSTAPYFNLNAYTPDGKEMVYTAPDGIHMLNLATRQTRLLVAGKMHPMCVGKKTATVYYNDPDTHSLCSVDVATGQVKKLAQVPPRGAFVSVNADETLAAGTYIEGTAGEDYGAKRVNPPGMSGPLVQPLNKGKMMEERLAAHLPMVLFTVDLKTGKMTTLLHSTDWINHLLFSPNDPTLLMYCHEGPWQKVDRIWTIRTDGSQNTLIHRRTMAMEIAGHEFWGLDGKTIWYDLQTPKGEDFWLAAYNLDTHERRWYHLQRNEWSIHFNLTKDESLFCGDGGDPGQVAKAPDGKWIELFRPELFKVTGENEKSFIQPGVFRSEHLVNMAKHNYKLEPNVRFSPDEKMVIFSSNMFGPSYVFGVDVDK
ncbi:MAG: oligogalacturonate lyase family protein [Phycisphaerae bacterium]